MVNVLFWSLVMEAISALISLGVGYYAYKAYKASNATGLLLLYLGFVILGVSLSLRVTTYTYVIVLRVSEAQYPALRSVIPFGGVVFSISQLIAYSLFAASYTIQAKARPDETAVLALAPGLYLTFFNPFLELVLLVIIGYVAGQAFIKFVHRPTGNSFLVSTGFACMLVGHLCFLFMVVEEDLLLVVGHISQLAGFLCLLAMLARATRK